VFDEGFKIFPGDLSNTLAYALAEGKEQGNRRERTQKRPWFMVQTPLVAHVPVKMIRIPKLHAKEFLEDTVDKSLLTGFFMIALV
jgi:hypothetical protein